jgi:hypothetical protein
MVADKINDKFALIGFVLILAESRRNCLVCEGVIVGFTHFLPLSAATIVDVAPLH